MSVGLTAEVRAQLQVLRDSKRTVHKEEDVINLISDSDEKQEVSSEDNSVDFIQLQSDSDNEELDASDDIESTYPTLVCPWRDNAAPFTSDNMTFNLHEEILDFAKYISPNVKEHNIRLEILQGYTDIVTELWPTAVVKPFGSFITRLYLPNSDIDIVVRKHNGGSAVTCIKKLASILRQRDLVSYIEEVTKARIPILKFKDMDSGIEIDVCFDVPGGEETSQYIIEQQRRFPALRPLVLILKMFLHVRSLNLTFTGGVGSFLLTCMVISYLQLHPGRFAGNKNWKTVDSSSNLGALLFGFFELYGKQFRYEKCGICLEGDGYYFSKAIRDRELKRPEPINHMCLLNPMDPKHDVAANSYAIHKVRRAFLFAYQTLGSKRFRQKSKDRVSILGYLFTVPQIMIEMRHIGHGAEHETAEVEFPPIERKMSKSEARKRLRRNKKRLKKANEEANSSNKRIKTS